jgi:molybdopterin converting factor small subunit
MQKEYWFGNTSNSQVYVVTDNQQFEKIQPILSSIKCKDLKVCNINERDFELSALELLERIDLVIVALSYDSFVLEGFNNLFSPFRKPQNLKSNYVFIRLDISAKSLNQGLSTDIELVKEDIKRYKSIEENTKLKVSSINGTNIIFDVNKFKTCNHYISDDSTMAFLPPSEIYAGIVLGSANGEIVVDVSVGQLYKQGQLLEQFGLVDKHVKLIVENSRIIDVLGNDTLKDRLNQLEAEDRVLVELGVGLSDMTPTGIIGIDESIRGTCHFGIGDGQFYGIDNKSSIHLDVVIDTPVIEVV